MTQNPARTFLSSTTVGGLFWSGLWSGLLAVPVQGCTEPTFRDAGSDAAIAEADPDAGDATDARNRSGQGLDASAGDVDAAEAGADADTSAEAGPDSSPATSVDASNDAEPDAAPLDSLPDWAMPLIGTFARRSVTFSYDDAPFPPINTRNVEYALMRITYRAGQLLVNGQMCSYTVSLKDNSIPATFKYASRLAPLSGHLYLGPQNTFSSETMLQHFGFDPARGNTCGASGRRTKFPEQTWISGTSCRCDPAPVPTAIDDCRVVDSDSDALPGITVRGPSPLGTTVIEYGLAFDFSVKIVEGKVNSGGLPEWREVRAQAPACINAAADGCSVGYNQLCPGGSTQLLRLSDQATCADLNPGDFGPVDPFPIAVDCRAKLGI